MHGLTQSALLKALGWSLFNSLWQMSLLWAFYHLFFRVFRNASARSRHGLAAILLLAGAGWTLLTFITSWWLGPAPGSYLLPLQPYGKSLLSVLRWFIDEGLSWCSLGYLLLVGGLLIRYVGHYLHSRRIANRGLLKIGPGFRVFVAETARNMGIASEIKVHLSSLVQVPVTLGFLRPVILFPVAMITHLSTQQIEAILVHELAHIRRKDYLIHLLATFMELVFFFNPFARLLIGQLKKESEHSCDDFVLQFRYDPHAYVSALLSLARHHREGRMAVAATGGGDNQLLLERAKKILQQQRTEDRPGARPLLLLFLTLGAFFLFLGRTTPVDHPEQVATVHPAPVVVSSIENNQRPIVNNPSLPAGSRRPGPTVTAPIAADAPTHTRSTTVRHRSAPHPLSASAPYDENVFLLHTSGPSGASMPAYADLVVIESRDFSIGSPPNNERDPVTPPATGEGFPFVPKSSFSFQSTDTLPPEDRLALMEMATARSIRLQVSRLQEELKTRLNVLQQARTVLARTLKNPKSTRVPQSISRQQLNLLLHDQLHLQEEYRLRLDSLERQLQQAARRLTTVYI